MSPSNIYIYYRHYNAESHSSRSRDPNKNRPDWFSYGLCLRNLIASCRHQDRLTVNLTIWYDGTLEDISIDSSMSELLTPDSNSEELHLNVIYNQWGNPSSSWVGLIDYILVNHKNQDDIIYLLEDDYLHHPEWVGKVADIYQSNINFDYLSLYDHADNYTLPTHKRFHTEFFHTKTQIWRSIFSTCGSFITTVKNIQIDELALKALPDFQLFLHLSLHGRTLLTAIPGISTHAMTGLESPAVDWLSISLKDKQNEK